MANPIPPSVKTCPGCKQQKPINEFGKNKRSADGMAYYCKPCFREVSKASYRKRKAEQGKKVRERPEVPAGSKYCPRCETVKLREEFGRNRAARDGVTAYCKPCHSRVMAENKAKNHGSEQSYLLKYRYGVSKEVVDDCTARQGGICVICLRNPAKHVDHDHETGLFRGLLCFGCNGGLGQFDDHPWRLREAARYLDGVGSHSVTLILQLDEEEMATLAGQPRRFDRRTDRDAELGSPRKYHLWQKYGLLEGDVQRLNRIQRGFCAICCDGRGEHIDHDHKTTRVRGLLCTGCNSGMGQFKDDPISLRRASDYVMRTLIVQIPDGEGGTRPSFTLPDVDPATVEPNGWEPVRKADGEARKARMAARYELELPWESELVEA